MKRLNRRVNGSEDALLRGGLRLLPWVPDGTAFGKQAVELEALKQALEKSLIGTSDLREI
jgi:hypothetical protein